MFHRRRSVFCRVWLNSKTFTRAPFLTHAKILWNHGTHAKISTHATTSPTSKFYRPTPPTPPTHPRYPRHPRDLADSCLADCRIRFRHSIQACSSYCGIRLIGETSWLQPHNGVWNTSRKFRNFNNKKKIHKEWDTNSWKKKAC